MSEGERARMGDPIVARSKAAANDCDSDQEFLNLADFKENAELEVNQAQALTEDEERIRHYKQ